MHSACSLLLTTANPPVSTATLFSAFWINRFHLSRLPHTSSATYDVQPGVHQSKKRTILESVFSLQHQTNETKPALTFKQRWFPSNCMHPSHTQIIGHQLTRSSTSSSPPNRLWRLSLFSPQHSKLFTEVKTNALNASHWFGSLSSLSSLSLSKLSYASSCWPASSHVVTACRNR